MSAGSPSPGQRVADVLWSLLLCVSTTLLGMLLGGLYVRLFVPKTGMGWDQIADVLGGLMVGAIAGLVLGIALVVWLAPRRRLPLALGALALSVLPFGALQALREEPPESAPIERKTAFEPWFKFTLRVGHSSEVLQAVEPGDEPLPFIDADVFTAVPELELTGWAAEAGRCRATPALEDLQTLEPLVDRAVRESAQGHCKTDRLDDLGVVFNWSRENARGNVRVEAACLADRPALAALAAAVDTLGARLCAPPSSHPATD